MSEALIAEAAVSNTAFSFDCLFSYRVPEKMTDKIKSGCRILVPFGKGNKSRTAMVMSLKRGECSKLKEVISLIDSQPVLSQELLNLAKYMRDTTFCTYYEAVKAMLPPGMNIKILENVEINKKFDDFSILSETEKEFFNYLLKCSKSELKAELSNSEQS